MWENNDRARQAAGDNIKRRIRFACWITKARIYTHTRTRTQNIFIAFPRQQWFREYASLLCYTYIACLLSRLLACRLHSLPVFSLCIPLSLFTLFQSLTVSVSIIFIISFHYFIYFVCTCIIKTAYSRLISPFRRSSVTLICWCSNLSAPCIYSV
jgi:hypothetical protein